MPDKFKKYIFQSGMINDASSMASNVNFQPSTGLDNVQAMN